VSRVRPLEREEMAPQIVEMAGAVAALTGDTTLIPALAHRPDIVRRFLDFYVPQLSEGTLGRKLVELLRLAVAQATQCPTCMSARFQDAVAQGVTEELVAALPDAERSPLFTERESVAIAFAKKMTTNHFAVTDNDFVALYGHFSEGEIVELCIDIGVFIGFGRAFYVLDATNPVCDLAPRAVVSS
jgi:AhpD family alkylhydroperoxidase